MANRPPSNPAEPDEDKLLRTMSPDQRQQYRALVAWRAQRPPAAPTTADEVLPTKVVVLTVVLTAAQLFPSVDDYRFDPVKGAYITAAGTAALVLARAVGNPTVSRLATAAAVCTTWYTCCDPMRIEKHEYFDHMVSSTAFKDGVVLSSAAQTIMLGALLATLMRACLLTQPRRPTYYERIALVATTLVSLFAKSFVSSGLAVEACYFKHTPGPGGVDHPCKVFADRVSECGTDDDIAVNQINAWVALSGAGGTSVRQVVLWTGVFAVPAVCYLHIAGGPRGGDRHEAIWSAVLVLLHTLAALGCEMVAVRVHGQATGLGCHDFRSYLATVNWWAWVDVAAVTVLFLVLVNTCREQPGPAGGREVEEQGDEDNGEDGEPTSWLPISWSRRRGVPQTSVHRQGSGVAVAVGSFGTAKNK
mgnify:CR=1 FL=1